VAFLNDKAIQKRRHSPVVDAIPKLRAPILGRQFPHFSTRAQLRCRRPKTMTCFLPDTRRVALGLGVWRSDTGASIRPPDSSCPRRREFHTRVRMPLSINHRLFRRAEARSLRLAAGAAPRKVLPCTPKWDPQNNSGRGQHQGGQLTCSSVAPKDGSRGSYLRPRMAGAALIGQTEFRRETNHLARIATRMVTAVHHLDPRHQTWTIAAIAKHFHSPGSDGPARHPDIFATLYKNVSASRSGLATGFPARTDITLASAP